MTYDYFVCDLQTGHDTYFSLDSTRKACTFSVYDVSAWPSGYCLSFRIKRTQVQALQNVRFFLNLNGLLLH